MNQQQGEALAKAQTTSEPGTQKAQGQPRYLLVSWILLLLLGALFFLASIFDLLADIRTGLPSDHLEAFRELTGLTWSSAQQTAPQIVRYVTTLEITYAVHEMVFALLFLLIVIFPFRRRARWSCPTRSTSTWCSTGSCTTASCRSRNCASAVSRYIPSVKPCSRPGCA